MNIITVTHKKFDDSILPTGYTPVAVGEFGSSESCSYQTDREGYSIWESNAYYCELTAQYWAWKNLKTDICGLVHYRRFFMKYRKSSCKITDDIMNQSEIDEILKKYKVILSFKHVKGPGAGVYYFDIPEEKNDFHWRILKKVIEQKYPEYISTFRTFMKGEFYSPCNMFISTKKVFDEYSEWIFNVLKGYDKFIDENGYEKMPRVDGFLSECLLNIYFLHNYRENDIYRMDFVNTELIKKHKYPAFIRTNHRILSLCEQSKARLKYLKNLRAYMAFKKSLIKK